MFFSFTEKLVNLLNVPCPETVNFISIIARNYDAILEYPLNLLILYI